MHGIISFMLQSYYVDIGIGGILSTSYKNKVVSRHLLVGRFTQLLSSSSS